MFRRIKYRESIDRCDEYANRFLANQRYKSIPIGPKVKNSERAKDHARSYDASAAWCICPTFVVNVSVMGRCYGCGKQKGVVNENANCVLLRDVE